MTVEYDQTAGPADAEEEARRYGFWQRNGVRCRKEDEGAVPDVGRLVRVTQLRNKPPSALTDPERVELLEARVSALEMLTVRTDSRVRLLHKQVATLNTWRTRTEPPGVL
jgi:hypothetical protein